MPFILRLLGIKIDGQHQLKRHKQFIIVANHNSHLDTMSIMSSIPFRQLLKTHPVATAQYFGSKKWLVLLSNLFINTVLIKRKEELKISTEISSNEGQQKALLLLEEKLAKGHSLILFPEGTRGEPEKLQEFKKGIGVLLLNYPQIPYIPVYISGMGKILPKGEMLPVPFNAIVSIGKPKLIETNNVEDIVEEVKNAILDIQIKNRTA